MKKVEVIIAILAFLLLSNVVSGQKHEVVSDKYSKIRQEMPEKIQKLMKKYKTEVLLSPLNNTEVITPGIGRSANHTLYITKDSGGGEVLNFLGFKFKRKPQT